MKSCTDFVNLAVYIQHMKGGPPWYISSTPAELNRMHDWTLKSDCLQLQDGAPDCMIMTAAAGVEEHSMCSTWVALDQASKWPVFSSTSKAAMPLCSIIASLPASSDICQHLLLHVTPTPMCLDKSTYSNASFNF